MEVMQYTTETVKLTPGEFDALRWVNAQSWIDDYADPDNREQTMYDDELTEEEWEIEHAKAKLFQLTGDEFTFVRGAAAFDQAVFGLEDAEISPFDTTVQQRAGFRRCCRSLIAKLNI